MWSKLLCRVCIDINKILVKKFPMTYFFAGKLKKRHQNVHYTYS